MVSSAYIFKYVGKIPPLYITKRLRNLLDLPILQEQPFGHLHPFLRDKLTKCHSRHFLEQAGKITWA